MGMMRKRIHPMNFVKFLKEEIMFQFALKDKAASVEGQAVVVETSSASSEVSSGFLQWVNERILDNLISSLARRLFATGCSPADINSKMFELVGELGKRKDVSDIYQKYVKEWDPAESADDDSKTKLYALKIRTANTFSDFYDIVYSASRVIRWSGEDNKKRLNDRELEMFKEYEEAQRKYWAAQDKISDYCYDCAIEQLNEVILKYSDAISKIDAEWLGKVTEILKDEMAWLKRRREAKKAEGDSSLNRPVEG